MRNEIIAALSVKLPDDRLKLVLVALISNADEALVVSAPRKEIAKCLRMTTQTLKGRLDKLSEIGFISIPANSDKISLRIENWRDVEKEAPVSDPRFPKFVEAFMEEFAAAGTEYRFTGRDGAAARSFLSSYTDTVEVIRVVIRMALSDKFLRAKAGSVMKLGMNYPYLKLEAVRRGLLERVVQEGGEW